MWMVCTKTMYRAANPSTSTLWEGFFYSNFVTLKTCADSPQKKKTLNMCGTVQKEGMWQASARVEDYDNCWSGKTEKSKRMTV